MSTPNQPDSPAYICASAAKQIEALQTIRDLSGGTPAMRKAGTRYLPQEQGEKQESYQIRLSRSLLFNTFVKVREGLLGIALKPKKKKQLPEAAAAGGNGESVEVDEEINDSDIQLKDDVPPQLRVHMEDIDLNGGHLDVFVKDLFRNVINDGHAFILVDMQPPLPFSVTSAASIPDASDEIAAGRRPYWVRYTKDQAVNWSHDRINSATALTRITFRECITKSDGEYGEKEVIRYRVLKLPLISPAAPGRSAVYGLMRWELYEKQVISNKEELVLVDGNVTDLARIPVVPIYARRTGFLESQPPLEDLAYLNVGHWQQWSDINNQLRLLTPILCRKLKEKPLEVSEPTIGTANAKRPEQVKLGPGVIVDLYGEDADLFYRSHDGTAIGSAREALMDLEQRMSAVGLSIISQKQDAKAQVTATEKLMDQGERESELASWLRALKDGVELAMEIHAVDYLGLPTGGSIVLGFDEADPQAVQAVSAPMPPNMRSQNTPPQNAGMMQ